MTENYPGADNRQGQYAQSSAYPSAPPYTEPAYPQAGYSDNQQFGTRSGDNGKGLAAMVLGIIALCTWWIPFLYLITAVPMSIIAIVLGAQAKGLNEAGRASNPGQAKAGFICGIIGIALCVINGVAGIVLALAR